VRRTAPTRPVSPATTSPFRNPERATPQQMRTRAWLMLLMTILFPGTAQLVGGNRTLGRIAIRVTLFIYAFGALALLVTLIHRPWLLALLTLPLVGPVISWVVIGYAIYFFILMIDTLRLAQLGRLFPVDKWIALTAFALVGVLGSSSLVYAGNLMRVGTSTVNEIFSRVGFTGTIDGRYNILLVGSDAGPDRFGERTDSLSVMSIDANSGHASLIGIPRNLQKVPFVEGSPMRTIYPNGWSCGVNCLINAIYKDVMDNHQDLYPDAVKNGSNPGIEAVRDAVEGVTGLQIQSYVQINMDGFAKLIDALGGVDVMITQDLPVGGQLDDGSDATGWLRASDKPKHLDGYLALWFARSRHTTTDYSRMQRQHALENAILKQMNPSTILSRFEAIASASKDMVATDIPAGMLGEYIDLALKAKKYGIKTLELVPANGFEPDLPDYNKIHNAVKKFLATGKLSK